MAYLRDGRVVTLDLRNFRRTDIQRLVARHALGGGWDFSRPVDELKAALEALAESGRLPPAALREIMGLPPPVPTADGGPSAAAAADPPQREKESDGDH